MTFQVYLDTSALVKRYVAEDESGAVADFLNAAEYQAASIVTEAELPAALGRATRVGAIRAAAHKRADRILDAARFSGNRALPVLKSS